MTRFYFTFLLALLTTALWCQDEEPIPGALIGSCIESDSNLVRIFADYNKNCPDADPTNLLAGQPELRIHSGINNWSTVVDFADEGATTIKNLGNDIFTLDVNTMDYFGSPLADIEDVRFIPNNAIANPSDPWEASMRDDQGGGGFGGDEPCNDFALIIANLPTCSELSQESSVSLFGPTTAANSCTDSTNNMVTIEFDLSLNCPEADPGNLLSGAQALGFHSGANDWASTVNWDDSSALTAINKGNDIFAVTVDPMAYYGVALSDLENIIMVMNNGVSNPADPWTNTGKDERDGGFGGAEPCSDLVFSLAEAEFCPVTIDLESSESVIEVSGEVSTCVDPSRGKVRISFDLSKNCPEADTANALAGSNALGFHSGANDWAHIVPWDADSAMQATNNGNDIFTVTIDVMAYYGIPFDSLTNIKFILNNGPANPDDPWTVTGRDPRDAGAFGEEQPCSDLVLSISEAGECDLPDVLTSIELTSGLAASCVDMANGKVRIDWDRNQNCPAADSTNMLGDTIVLHSGVNGWVVQVPFDDSTSKKPVNDGNGLYSEVIDIEAYYGLSIDSVSEINFLFNNAVANPDDPWANTGKTNKEGGGFGGDEPCDNFLLVLSELPACDLAEQLSSQELFTGLAATCVDPATGKIQLDFDRNQNCVEADPDSLLGDTIVLHSGVNNWATQVAWDAENSLKPVNDGNGLYRLVFNLEEYYGIPYDSISEVNFLYNNGVVNPDTPWANTGLATTGMGGFGGDELCDNFRLVMAEAPTCDLSERQISNALISGLAASCVDPTNGMVRLDFDINLNCPDADPGGILLASDTIGFHSGINNWATQVAWDDAAAYAAVNDGNGLFSIVIDVESYYSTPLSQINEINFLYNNGFGDEADIWANTGKDSTGMGGFGGDETCDNFLFLPANAATCELSTSTVDRQLESSLKVVPNPFSDDVLIEFENLLNKQFALTIVDVTGKVVRTITNLTGNQVRLQRGNLHSGIYFAHLRDKSGKFATAKIIVK